MSWKQFPLEEVLEGFEGFEGHFWDKLKLKVIRRATRGQSTDTQEFIQTFSE